MRKSKTLAEKVGLEMNKDEDAIIIAAMLKRFTDQRFPKVLDLEKKVLTGEKLNDSELSFLDIVFKDAQHILKLTDKYPEYQEIVSKALKLYSDITQKALENENK